MNTLICRKSSKRLLKALAYIYIYQFIIQQAIQFASIVLITQRHQKKQRNWNKQEARWVTGGLS